MNTKYAIKTFALLLIGLLSFFRVHAQEDTKAEQPTAVKSLNKIRLNFLGINYEREEKVGKQTTFYVGGGLASALLVELQPTYNIDNNYVIHYNNDSKVYFNIAPNIYAGLRKYYNFESRIKKGKKTINNSGSYYGLDMAAYLKPLLKRSDYVLPDWEIALTPQWGFQHAMGKKTSFELALGPTVHFNDSNTYFGVDGRIGFSFIF